MRVHAATSPWLPYENWEGGRQMSAIAFRICVVVLVATVTSARSSSADPVVIYSNFGPAPGYLQGTWDNPFLDPQGWVNSDENAYSMGFQLSEAAQLSSIALPVVWGPSLPEGFSVSLRVAEGGVPFPMNTLLERIVVPVPEDAQPGDVSMLTLPSALQPMLSANTLYFLTAFATGSLETSLGAFGTIWPWNNAGIQGLVVNSTAGGVASRQGPLGAFQVHGEVNPVPEPATVLLIATGGGLVAQRIRKHRRT
jgi:hypothetical protein